MLSELVILLFGEEQTLAWWIAAMIWASIGTTISMAIKVKKRKKIQPDTPRRFSWRFFIQDNLINLFMNLLIIFTLLRFLPTFIGEPATLEFAIILGLLSDQLVDIVTRVQNRARNNYFKF